MSKKHTWHTLLAIYASVAQPSYEKPWNLFTSLIYLQNIHQTFVS